MNEQARMAHIPATSFRLRSTELKAIEPWDDCYFGKKVRHESDEISHRACRERWQEIMREISTLAESEHEAARQQSGTEFGEGAIPGGSNFDHASSRSDSAYR